MPEDEKIKQTDEAESKIPGTEEESCGSETAETNEDVCKDTDTSNEAEPTDGGKTGTEKKKSFFSKKQETAEHKKTLEELESLKKANEELKERYMRLAAEYENYKRRTLKEMETKYTDVKGDTLKSVLPILDNFERAMKTAIPEGCETYSEGIKMIYDQLLGMLAAQNVEEIPSLGETFDPLLHYAVMHIEDENLGENTVAEVFEKGYRMGDKVLRYSMVKVAN